VMKCQPFFPYVVLLCRSRPHLPLHPGPCSARRVLWSHAWRLRLCYISVKILCTFAYFLCISDLDW
jgi:hypothetical protein